MQQDLLQVLFPKLKIIVFVAKKVSSMQNSTESFFSCCKNAQNAETQKRNELGVSDLLLRGRIKISKENFQIKNFKVLKSSKEEVML